VVDDASQPGPFAGDDYLRRSGARSVLCLPLVKADTLIGALYLENHLTPRVFTADRVSLLEILASLAAISLENARRYAELEEAGRFLEEAQRLSHTGSFGWNPTTGETVLSTETYDILGFERGRYVPLDLAATRIHPEDREGALAHVDAAVRANAD